MDIRTLEPSALSTVTTVSELSSVSHFSFHWQRLLKTPPLNFSFSVVHANFWSYIVSEILDISGMNISRIAEATDIPANTIYALKWNDLEQIELSIDRAKKLLVLHGEIRPDLRPVLEINSFCSEVTV